MRKVSTRGVNREAIGRLEELRRDGSRGTVGIALFSILSPAVARARCLRRRIGSSRSSFPSCSAF